MEPDRHGAPGLPKKLSTHDAPAGVDPSRGDIACYAPWGNLAIFYKDFQYSRGLVKLGRIDSTVEMFEKSRALKVTMRRVDGDGPRHLLIDGTQAVTWIFRRHTG